jgi:hypothetical protein
VLVKEPHNTYLPLPILLLHGSHLHYCVNLRMCNFAGGGSGSPWKKGLPPLPSGRGTTGDPGLVGWVAPASSNVKNCTSHKCSLGDV